MIYLTLEDLKQLLSDGRQAKQYAWDHYEELAARKAVYTLYGPYAYGTGAAIPWSYTPKRARNLTLKTRRTKYNIYELDSEYKLLRVTQVLDSVSTNTYHCYELCGVQYACPFVANRKKEGYGDVWALSYKDGKPHYSAFLSKNVLFAHFFEYVSQEKVLITEYAYNPVSKYTLHGQLTDLNAPIGALNSAVQRLCFEEEPMYIDFSQWFKKAAGNPIP